MGKNKNRLFDQTRITKGIPVSATAEKIRSVDKKDTKVEEPFDFKIPFEIKYVIAWIIIITLLHLIF